MIVAQPQSGIAYEVQETPHLLIFSTSAIEIQIQKETTAFIYRDRRGQVLTKEPERGGKTLTPTPVYRSIFDEATVRAGVQGADGARVRVEGVRQVLDRQAYSSRGVKESTYDGNSLIVETSGEPE